jgi:hypothetical protein
MLACDVHSSDGHAVHPVEIHCYISC